MHDYVTKHLLPITATPKMALQRLNELAADAVLFLVDDSAKLVGALTDGDIRRSLIEGKGLDRPLMDFIQSDPKVFQRSGYDLAQMQKWRALNYRIIPVVDKVGKIIDVINFRSQRSYLPLDAVIMAGGLGSRLRPLTDNTPKPMLEVGGRPILEHNVLRLRAYGVTNLTISIKYLGEQIIDHFGDGSAYGMNIRYVTEDEPRGTIGAVSNVQQFHNPYLLVMNSDLLTTIDFEDMFADFLDHEADMAVATVPYEVKIPYGVIETDGQLVMGLHEKPTYTYYSNAGIYMLKQAHVGRIPTNSHYNAPDLMADLYGNGFRVTHFPIHGYWLDIGKHDDFAKAQRDIEHLNL